MSWTTPIRGHCFCGACSYTIDPTVAIPPETIEYHKGTPAEKTHYECINDHCSSCRRAASNLSVSWIIFPTQWLSWSAGSSDHLKTYKSSNDDVERQFCGTCGTSFSYFRHSRNLVMDVNLATLCEEDLAKVEERGLVPGDHAWCNWGVGWWLKVFANAAKGSGKEMVAYGTGRSDPEERIEI